MNCVIQDQNFSRLLNTFKVKPFTLSIVNDEYAILFNIFYKGFQIVFVQYTDGSIYNVVAIKHRSGRDNEIEYKVSMLPSISISLDAFGMTKCYNKICKILNIYPELSENTRFNYTIEEKPIEKQTTFEKKTKNLKLKPYYKAFLDEGFQDTVGIKNSKGKDCESVSDKPRHSSNNPPTGKLRPIINIVKKNFTNPRFRSKNNIRKYIAEIQNDIEFYKNI